MINILIHIGIDITQYVAWMHYDGRYCPIHKLETQPAPMPWVEFSKN